MSEPQPPAPPPEPPPEQPYSLPGTKPVPPPPSRGLTAAEASPFVEKIID